MSYLCKNLQLHGGKLEIQRGDVPVAKIVPYEASGPARTAGALPLTEHRDPFDRLLVAQAFVEGLPLISNDARFDQYGIKRRW